MERWVNERFFRIIISFKESFLATLPIILLVTTMRWAVLATAILVTVCLMVSFPQFGAVKANPGPFECPTIHIDSPRLYQGGKIYREASIPIKVDVHPWWSPRKFVDIYYSLDGGSNITLAITTYETSTAISGIGTLDNLTDGYHTVEAYSTDTQGNTISDSISFLVDATPPKITDLSVNITDSSDRLLYFTVDAVDAEASWVGYSLDKKANVTVTGDVVLGDLPFGSHNVTVYANDTVGNMGASETLFFTVEPFPIIPVVAGIGTTASVGIGLLVYFKKRKR